MRQQSNWSAAPAFCGLFTSSHTVSRSHLTTKSSQGELNLWIHLTVLLRAFVAWLAAMTSPGTGMPPTTILHATCPSRAFLLALSSRLPCAISLCLAFHSFWQHICNRHNGFCARLLQDGAHHCNSGGPTQTHTHSKQWAALLGCTTKCYERSSATYCKGLQLDRFVFSGRACLRM